MCLAGCEVPHDRPDDQVAGDHDGDGGGHQGQGTVADQTWSLSSLKVSRQVVIGQAVSSSFAETTEEPGW